LIRRKVQFFGKRSAAENFDSEGGPVVLQFEVLAREMGELRVFVPTQQESKYLGQYRTGYGPGERNSILAGCRAISPRRNIQTCSETHPA
jgi:hypothetical protein